MENNSLLNISQLSNELQAGEPIIKFLLKRFKNWIPGINHDGEKCYQHQTLTTLVILLDKINNGILPSVIDEEFKNDMIHSLPITHKTNAKSTENMQERYVKALEKRNEIEILKVNVLNSIADKLDTYDAKLSDNTVNQVSTTKIQTDDLSLLINLDEKQESIIKTEIDDLSLLIDKDSEQESNNEAEIDNLAALLNPEAAHNENIDNLSLLLESDTEPAIIDDLSMLIDNGQHDKILEMDDLSLLIQDNDQKTDKIDDLSLLTNDLDFKNGKMDDLSALIDEEPAKDVSFAVPKFSPKDDFENYKAEIINIIIDLKNQGLTEEETCDQFNKKGILTFSGKDSWSVKTISQVYQLINNAA